jgi:hypothetical protein
MLSLEENPLVEGTGFESLEEGNFIISYSVNLIFLNK